MTSEVYIRIKNLNETKILAQKLSKLLSIPFFICLCGDIGSGKTTFARFLINQFSKKKIKVLSPTFPIVQIYDLKNIDIWHYDLYRINSTQELFEIGVDNYFMQDGLHFIEWASKYTNFLPHPDYQIQFHNYNPYRILKITDYVKQR